MSLGGFIAGLTVALAAGLVARSTILREDASLAAFYLVSLALGVLIVSVKGSNIDLLHVLFGTVLALDDAALILVAGIATVSLAIARHHLPAARARMFRPAIFCARSAGRAGRRISLFLVLVVLNLVERLPGARHAARGRHHAARRQSPRASGPRTCRAHVSCAILAAFAASLTGLLLVLLHQRADRAPRSSS